MQRGSGPARRARPTARASAAATAGRLHRRRPAAAVGAGAAASAAPAIVPQPRRSRASQRHATPAAPLRRAGAARAQPRSGSPAQQCTRTNVSRAPAGVKSASAPNAAPPLWRRRRPRRGGHHVRVVGQIVAGGGARAHRAVDAQLEPQAGLTRRWAAAHDAHARQRPAVAHAVREQGRGAIERRHAGRRRPPRPRPRPCRRPSPSSR